MTVSSDADQVSQYLQALSERLRGLRARRGMTRKDLAKHSGISERYLAQLENGDANPSVELLWRIAQAMDISFQNLVVQEAALPHSPLMEMLRRLTAEEQDEAYSVLLEHFGNRSDRLHGVALIGLRGAGKTTLGSHLSARLGVPWLRLGDVIEQLAGMDRSEIFSLGGQKTYRRLERQAVDYVIEHGAGGVVEAGGSLVSEPDTFDALRSAFFTVWVRASPEEHMNRVVRQGDMRPIQGSSEAMDDLRRILAEREPYYATARYVLDTSGRPIDDCVAELERVCKPYLGTAGVATG